MLVGPHAQQRGSSSAFLSLLKVVKKGSSAILALQCVPWCPHRSYFFGTQADLVTWNSKPSNQVKLGCWFCRACLAFPWSAGVYRAFLKRHSLKLMPVRDSVPWIIPNFVQLVVRDYPDVKLHREVQWTTARMCTVLSLASHAVQWG